MKLVIICLAVISILSADEINRIESIVEDISNLREKYESCQKELDLSKTHQTMAPKIEVKKEKTYSCQKEKAEIGNYKELLKKEQEKNKVLTQKIDLATKKNSNKSKIDEIVSKFEKELKNKDELLKNKENEIISLKKEIQKIKENKQVALKNGNSKILQKKMNIARVCKDENSFPKLMMKEKNSTDSLNNESTYRTKPSTYRLKQNSEIYNAVNGQKIDEWEENTSFTSNIRSDGWVKITGYFVDRVWHKSPKELWIESKNVFQR